MNKRIPEMTAVPGSVWTRRVRACWPVLPLTAMGMITLVALSHPSTRADGPTWTLPYQGTYTNNGVNSGIDVFINNTGTGTAIQGQCLNGSGIIGVSAIGTGVYGATTSGYGVQGTSNYIGILGNSTYIGILGNTNGGGPGIVGQGNAYGTGVLGNTLDADKYGVQGANYAATGAGAGVTGSGPNGVIGTANVPASPFGTTASGVAGYNNAEDNFGNGVSGVNASGHGYGVYGYNNFFASSPLHNGHWGAGVYGQGDNSKVSGVYGIATYLYTPVVGDFDGAGVRGEGLVGVKGYGMNTGVLGAATTYGMQGNGIYGVSGFGNGTAGSTYGIYGDTSASDGNYAGYFHGNVKVTGTLTAAAKNFKIDHPLDPANKYLVHACVESNEMMNIYRGNVTLDSDGKATVQMPDWFQAENGDFSYQLTCIGGFAPVYVDKELQDNRFEVAGGKAGQKISWQVMGIRQDAYARAHPMQVEEDKTGREKGKYLNPVEQGHSKMMGIDYETRRRLLQETHSAPVIKAPIALVLPKTSAMPAPFKPIRVPAPLGPLNAPKSRDAKP